MARHRFCADFRSRGSGKDHLFKYASASPLEILCWTLMGLGFVPDAAKLLDIYQNFLRKVDDPAVRERLEKLPASGVYGDDEFLALREISHEWQSILRQVFLEKDSELKEFMLEFGVF